VSRDKTRFRIDAARRTHSFVLNGAWCSQSRQHHVIVHQQGGRKIGLYCSGSSVQRRMRFGKRPGLDLRFSRSANRPQYAATQKRWKRDAFEGFAQRIPEPRAERGFAHAFLRNSV
jgi:hypothetical protein